MRRPLECWCLPIRTGLLALLLAAASPAPADAADGPAGPADAPASDPAEAPPRSGLARRPRPAPPLWPASPDGGWSTMACLALVLAACGGLAVAARRLGPRAAAGAVQVVGRVSLSPKHSVYLLRVGRRVLVLGAGPQGPPALITELEEIPEESPAPRQGAES